MSFTFIDEGITNKMQYYIKLRALRALEKKVSEEMNIACTGPAWLRCLQQLKEKKVVSPKRQGDEDG